MLSPNLVELWEWRGGDTMFETEVIYIAHLSIEATRDYLVFHHGICVSTIRLN